jgi:hypothetical protein
MSAELLKELQSRVGKDEQYTKIVNIVFSEAVETPLTNEDIFNSGCDHHHFRTLFTHNDKSYEIHTLTSNDLNNLRFLGDRILYDIECLLFDNISETPSRWLIKVTASSQQSNSSFCNCGGPSKHVRFTSFEYDICTLCSKEKR